MFHLTNASIGLVLVSLTSLGPTPSASVVTDVRTDTCGAVSIEGHIVADRIDGAVARCEQLRPNVTNGQSAVLSVSDPVLAACVAVARADGFRPADRLERSILVCVHEAGR